MYFTRKNAIINYALFDFISAGAAWLLFYSFRKIYIEHASHFNEFIRDPKLLIGVPVVAIGWMLLYSLSNTYTDIYKKSRLVEIGRTLFQSVIGSVILFFTLLLDDVIQGYKDYYLLLLGLIAIHFELTLFFRLFVLSRAKNKLAKGKVRFNTLIIGGNDQAVTLYNEIQEAKAPLGYYLKGFIEVNGKQSYPLEEFLPKIGHLSDLRKVLLEEKIEEVILAVDSSEHKIINQVLNKIDNPNISVKVIPDILDILSGVVKLGNVYDVALIEIRPHLFTPLERTAKRILDILVSIAVLIFASPLFIISAIKVRLSSEGKILYQQERVGINGKHFKMYKFRSMFENAEADGPQLSSDNDPRITTWGKTMRKYRIDEFPQFINVLKGDMSLVGPRPERQFYVDQLIAIAPHYQRLHAVRPGITSWGMVKFGYASDINQMMERMKFDLLYIENYSFILDLRILLMTVATMFQGKGK